MKKTQQIILLLLIISCNKIKNTEVVNKNQKLQPPTPSEKINWLRNSKVKLEINNDLSHQKGFECDSVIGIDYIGFENEDFYYPINNKGEFISTIKKKQKLNNEQFSNLNSILGNRKTYEHPQIIGCYEPRLGFIYYKESKVIGQTQICLSCAQLHSTARTVGKVYGSSINDEARKKIDNLRIELGFSNGYK